jgi:hypothetical protein
VGKLKLSLNRPCPARYVYAVEQEQEGTPAKVKLGKCGCLHLEYGSGVHSNPRLRGSHRGMLTS